MVGLFDIFLCLICYCVRTVEKLAYKIESASFFGTGKIRERKNEELTQAKLQFLLTFRMSFVLH